MNKQIAETIRQLRDGIIPSDDRIRELLTCSGPLEDEFLFQQADEVRRQHFGNRIYIRGLIEFTSFCRNDCFYCGIRKSRKELQRYRLTEEQILRCCKTGYELGFRTFVLQGGEDPYWTDKKLTPLISAIRRNHPDCAVTLSAGERSRESYRLLFEAGAERYLLRHETADSAHYAHLHPADMDFNSRMQCLSDLMDLGYQTGCGFMVGSPGQTADHLVRELRFLTEFRPHMVGIGPFLPASETPFADRKKGSEELTVRLLAVIRLLLPEVLLPATTALGTASKDGRLRGILAGANVIMPNLSPPSVRESYALYDCKAASGAECAEGLELLKESVRSIGYEIVSARGDSPYRNYH